MINHDDTVMGCRGLTVNYANEVNNTDSILPRDEHTKSLNENMTDTQTVAGMYVLPPSNFHQFFGTCHGNYTSDDVDFD